MQLSLLKREYPKGEGVQCIQLNVELLRHSALLVPPPLEEEELSSCISL